MAQDFQRIYGTSLDNSFSKIIQDGADYYVLGQDQPMSGSLPHATVTRLDANGIHQWTLRLDIPSIWNDAVLTPVGDLIVVGATLPGDATNQSLMGLVTTSGGGDFTWIRSYDVAGRENLFHIVRSPNPETPGFPYYVSGTQFDPTGIGALWDDVILMNLDETGTFNWKKIYTLTSDDEFVRDLEVMTNGDLILAGNEDAQGIIFRTDNTGTPITGATPDGLSFTYIDITPSSNGGFYAIGTTFPAFNAHLMKYDNDLIGLWEVIISDLTALTNIWEDPSGGKIYITGTMLVGGLSRSVILLLTDTGSTATIDWVKYLDDGESLYSVGRSTFISPNQLGFVDGRVSTNIGFGQIDAFISISDLTLTSCMTKEDAVDVIPTSLLYNGPPLPSITFFDFPLGTDLTKAAVNWEQEDVCFDIPCLADFEIEILNCGNTVTFINFSSGPPPLTYSWDFGDPSSGINNTSTLSDPVHLFTGVCNNYTVCLTVLGDGCFDVVCKTVTLLYATNPIFTCPPDVVLNCYADTSPVTTGSAMLSAPCNGVAPTISFSDVVTGTPPCDVMIVRTWSATDQCGMLHTCVQKILVKDSIPPMIICPPNLTVQTNPGQCFYTGPIPLPTATDNCNPDPAINCYLVSSNGDVTLITPLTEFPKGDHIICCVADDGCVDVSELICNYPCEGDEGFAEEDILIHVVGDDQDTHRSPMTSAVIDIQTGIAADVLVKDVFVGGDCFDISNVTSFGLASQLGTFSNGLSNIGFNSGVILSTGPAVFAVGPNDDDQKGVGFFGPTPDADLSTLTAGVLFDKAGLEFDFIPTQSPITFNFVFAAEEYCELVGNSVTDVFGFFISGPGIPFGTQNIALIPTTNTPVGINTVNHLTNSGFYINNQPATSSNLCGQSASTSPSTTELQYDGFTRKFTAVAVVVPGQTYHLKMAIADAGNNLSDAAIFLDAGSFDAGGNVSTKWEAKSQPVSTTAYEDCGTVNLVFERVGVNINLPVSVSFAVSGSAQSGIDYGTITSPIVIPAGQSQFVMPVAIFNDGVIEGDETIIITLSVPCSFTMPQSVLTIKDKSLLQAKCTYTLTVGDHEPPMITCPPNISVNGFINGQGTCEFVVGNLAPQATDNCPMLMIDYSIAGATNGSGMDDASGTTFLEGTSTVTYTGTDMNGNTATCSFTVTVTCVDTIVDCCLEWAKRLGGQGSDEISSLSQDGQGNIYVSGIFSGTADFDPGPATFNLTSAGLWDVFVAKLDPAGNFIWAVSMGGAGLDTLSSTIIDPQGNIYISGAFEFTVDFDPGSGAFNLTSNGHQDVFVVKLDPLGNFIWANGLGGGVWWDVGKALALDAGGDVYLIGDFGGTVDFDPGPGVFNMSGVGSFNDDIFILKLSAAGLFIWAKQVGGTWNDLATDISIDANGNIYYVGTFGGTVDFDPGPGTFNLSTSASNIEMFVSKLDPSGNFLWAGVFSSTAFSGVNAIAIDSQDDIFLTGYFHGTADFDPGPGSFLLTSAGSGGSIFVCKLTPAGNLIWANQMGGGFDAIGNDLEIDGKGNVYTTGYFGGTVDFDPGPSTSFLTSYNSYRSGVIQKMDNAGKFIWAKQIEGQSWEISNDILLDVNGSIYTSGLFIGAADFYPGTSIYPLSSAGNASDAFISKLSMCPQPDTCTCGAFTDLVIRFERGPGVALTCGGAPVNLSCPPPGYSYTLSGKFECQGSGCPGDTPFSSQLEQPDGTILSLGTQSATPFFGVPISNLDLQQAGVYTLTLTGQCGTQFCTCVIRFIIDPPCLDACPCSLQDIQAFNLAVDQGFASVLSTSSCKACFTPIALSDCETVEWYLNNTGGTPIGTSTAGNSFCYQFPGAGTYTVLMVVTRKKTDGTNCETFVKSQKVSITCVVWDECSSAVFVNPSFGEGAVEGDLDEGGSSSGWKKMKPAQPKTEADKRTGSYDGWAINLSGNLESSGILTSIDPVCIEKDSGLITVRIAVNDSGVQIAAKKAPDRPRNRLEVRLFRGDNFDIDFTNCNELDCYTLASIPLSNLDTGWHELHIPYNLKRWLVLDDCGVDEAIRIRPALYVTNALMDDQGGAYTYSFAQLDNFCFDEMIVAVDELYSARQFRIYPNPNHGTFTVELSEPILTDMSMYVTTLTGQILLKKNIMPDSQLQTIEANDLPQGMYLLQIVSDRRVMSVNKFVKQ